MRAIVSSVLALVVTSFASADPLKFMPIEAGVVIKIETPRALVEGAVKLDAYKEVQAFPQVKEVLDSAGVRRLFQVLKHIENETGSAWPDLIDKVAGRGIALGFKPGMDPAPTLAVIEGTDIDTVKTVYAIYLAGVKDEATRNEQLKYSEIKIVGVPVFTLGDDFFTARVDDKMFFSNKKTVLEISLKIANDANSHQCILEKKSFQQARKLVGDHPAAWLWFDLATAKETKEGQDFFANTRKELVQLLAFGSSTDAARRSDFLAAGLYASAKGYTVSVRMPAKRADLDSVMRLHVPADGVAGSKPLLEPKGVIASQSFHLDIGHLWMNRKEIIADETQRKDIEKGVADISKLLPNTSLGRIFETSGPYHRFVAAHTGEVHYKTKPGQLIPAIAYIGSMKDAAYGQSLNGILRAGGLLAGFQTGWKMSEAKHDGIDIVSYKFPDTSVAKFDDADNLRFNAVPSFAIVNQSLIVASTPGLVKDLIPILKKERETDGADAVWRMKAYSAGIADVLAADPEATVTETILQQGISLGEAKEQIVQFSKWLRRLGTASLSIHHDANMYKFDIEVLFNK